MTVDDLQASFQAGPDTDAAFDAPDRAFRTASWLHDEEVLEFVVAPLRDDDGIVIRRLSERDRPWASGPYAEPVRWLLQANAGDLQRRLQE